MTEIEALKQKLVWCIRMMDMVGLVEHNGHLSARIPGTDRVFIQSRFSSRAALTEKDILTVEEVRQAPKQTLGALGKRRTWKVWNYNVSLAKKRGVLD